MKKFIFYFFLFFFNSYALEVRLKDIARINGIRQNQIVGYGLVVGLAGTGDKMSQMTLQAVQNYLKNMDISLDIQANQIQNIASVFLTAKLPSYSKTGDKLDVTVSSIGNAKSIEGGVLLQSPLKSSDGTIMAVASGIIAFGGKNQKKSQSNQKTVGTIYDGAIVEKELDNKFLKDNKIRIILKEQDFSNLSIVSQAINDEFGLQVQTDLPNILVLDIPPEQNLLQLLANLEELKITPSSKAKIIINERTGIVVMGGNITVRESAISIDNKKTNLSLNNRQAPKRNFLLKESTKISEIVDILNEMGLNTKEVISVLQSLKKTGALYAQLEVE